jgi:hypothetical protein
VGGGGVGWLGCMCPRGGGERGRCIVAVAQGVAPCSRATLLRSLRAWAAGQPRRLLLGHVQRSRAGVRAVAASRAACCTLHASGGCPACLRRLLRACHSACSQQPLLLLPAGQHFEIRDEGDWWAAVPREEWPEDAAQQRVRPWGACPSPPAHAPRCLRGAPGLRLAAGGAEPLLGGQHRRSRRSRRAPGPLLLPVACMPVCSAS